jgi:hypothetical protein
VIFDNAKVNKKIKKNKNFFKKLFGKATKPDLRSRQGGPGAARPLVLGRRPGSAKNTLLWELHEIPAEIRVLSPQDI